MPSILLIRTTCGGPDLTPESVQELTAYGHDVLMGYGRPEDPLLITLQPYCNFRIVLHGRGKW
jgi:hypothetical protein